MRRGAFIVYPIAFILGFYSLYVITGRRYQDAARRGYAANVIATPGPIPRNASWPVVDKKKPHVCILWDGLHGQRVNIEMNGSTVYDGAFTGDIKVAPKVDCVPVVNASGKKDGLIVKAYFGKPYRAATVIDWRKGPRVIIGFLESGTVDIKQDDGKTGFK